MALSRSSRDRQGGGGGSKFKYEPRSYEEAKKHAERPTGRFDRPVKEGFEIFRARPGENAVRILPATWPDNPSKHFGYSVWLHPYVGYDKSTYACPRKMLNEPCPICDASDMARRDGDEDEAGNFMAKERFMYWILDRDADKQLQLQPQVWIVSGKLDQEITQQSLDNRNNSYLKVEDPEAGYDLFFQKTGQQLKTRYPGIKYDRDSTPIAEDARDQDDVLDYITENPLPDILLFYPAKHLANAIAGVSPDRDELDDKTDREPRRGSRDNGSGRDRDRGRSRDARRGDDEELARGDDGYRARSRDEPDEEEESRDSRRGEPREARGRRSGRDEGEDARDRRGRSRAAAEPEEDPETDPENEPEPEERPAREERRSRTREEPAEERSSRRGGGRERVRVRR